MAARSDKPVAKATKAKPLPVKKSPELFAEICARISEGNSLERVCREPGMPTPRAVMNWLRDHPDFKEAYDKARFERGDRYGERVADIVEAMRNGELDYNTARIAADCYKWAAARMAPRLYGDKLETTVNVVSTNEQHLSAVRELADLRRKQQQVEDNTIDVDAFVETA